MFLSKLNYYYLRILQEIAFRTEGSFSKPVSAILLLINRCNARCLHCHSWKLPGNENEMNTEEWYSFLDELRSWLGPIFISLTGGETLLRKDSIDIARYAAELGFWVEFLSNGYLLNDEKAEKLINSGVKRIKISLDGSTKEIHDRIRGIQGLYNNAVRALGYLVKHIQKSGNQVQLYAKTAIMNNNISDLSNIVCMVNDMKIYGVEFQALEPIYYSDQLGSRQWYKNNSLWINEIDKVYHAIEKLKFLKHNGYPIINTIENLDLIKNYFENPEKHSHKVHSHEYKKMNTRCRSWLGGLQVNPDGGMKMCHWMNPFANAKAGQISKAWSARPKCWKTRCKYL